MKHAERKAMDRELKRKKLSSALQANIISKVGGHENDARFRGFMMDITSGRRSLPIISSGPLVLRATCPIPTNFPFSSRLNRAVLVCLVSKSRKRVGTNGAGKEDRGRFSSRSKKCIDTFLEL